MGAHHHQAPAVSPLPTVPATASSPPPLPLRASGDGSREGCPLEATNRLPADNPPASGTITATVNCSCGDKWVSPRYGLFLTYPLDLGRGDARLGGGAVRVLVAAGADGPCSRGITVTTGWTGSPGRDCVCPGPGERHR
ncbi:unnamed protein product [Urochloa humidicola]